MGFSERAVARLCKDFDRGEVRESTIRDILRCDFANVLMVIPFLEHALPSVRSAASRVVAAKGDPNIVIDKIQEESSEEVIRVMLSALGVRGEGNLENLVFLLQEEEWSILRGAATDMFRMAGREDCLLPLLFSRSDFDVDLAKRCINEQKRRTEKNSSTR